MGLTDAEFVFLEQFRSLRVQRRHALAFYARLLSRTEGELVRDLVNYVGDMTEAAAHINLTAHYFKQVLYENGYRLRRVYRHVVVRAEEVEGMPEYYEWPV